MEVLFAHLGYIFQNTALLTQALTHRSVGQPHNERLEFLGDAILNVIITTWLFERFPHAKEGELSRMRSCLVNEAALYEIAQTLQLDKYLHIGDGEKKIGARVSMQADAVEAVIGALFLDGGLGVCQSCLMHWYADRLKNITPENKNKDPKSILQEWVQSKKQPLPTYQVTRTKGSAHQQTFYVACQVGPHTAQGVGSNRRHAEQDAASKILEKLIGLK